ncbi:uncharacterized mitochondrial protein AtMg00310-like [Hibiscus syriacus]|uniref:uncharacterized mitochondrial protein AtMg00310-like n=1 Tax=Hibiscus syriacus TaxID=106335 RepID=UPI001922D9E2|nr:uncharacterized mitochondrial protein AtMg00310-like [Hibiscus syriacus]
MQCFLLSITLCRAMEQGMAKFRWRSNKTRNGIHWSTWSYLTRAKSGGGLSFRDLCQFNVTLLTKQYGRLIPHLECLPAKVLRARYYPRGNFLTANLGSSPSYIWQSIWSARGLIEKGHGWRLGNGRVKPRSIDIRFIKVSDLIYASSVTCRYNVLKDIFYEEQVSKICSIPLSKVGMADALVWRPDGSGKYSVKSCYRLLRGK